MVFRISGPSDAVALAVSMGGHLPESEVSVMMLNPSASRPGVAMARIGDPSAQEAQLFREGLESMPFLDAGEFMVVVFGTHAQADMVGQAVRQIRPQALVFSFTDGLARRWHEAGVSLPVDGEPLDLTTHPFVADAVVHNRLRLQTRAEIRASFAPAQYDPERTAEAGAVIARERLIQSATDPAAAAARVHADAIAPYLDAPAGITVTAEHAGMLACAFDDLAVRDLLFAEFTTERVADLSELFRQVGAHLEGKQAAPAIILAAVCAWVDRQAATAREALTLGLELDPGHNFGRLIERALDHGMNPTMWEQLRTAAHEARLRAE